MLSCDTYLMPENLKDALVSWGQAPQSSTLIAGATDILPWAREGRAGDVHFNQMIDLSRVEELSGYKVEGEKIHLGANVVFQDFLTDGGLKRLMPGMPYCAIWFADDQIRQQATLIGNLVNASPAADGTPPMLTHNAEVELARLKDGQIETRTVKLTEFITGPGRTDLGDGEIATAVICDTLEGYGGSFEKVGQRRSLVISTVCTACVIKLCEDGKTFADIRIALGGTGPVPVRLTRIEEFLIGKEISADTISAASQLTDGLVNSRTRREYRADVVRGFIARAIEDALHDSGHRLAVQHPKESANV